jgi:acyl-CoA synthetase (AMP-forming)/AMP-acid ligase II
LPTLRKLFTGGAPVFPRLLDQMQRMAPNAEVEAVYGSTEAEPIAHLARPEIAAEDRRAMVAGRGLLAGPPIAQIHLRILRDRWGQVIGPFTAEEFAADCLSADEPGEIVAAGDHVLRGYLHGRGDEETKFRVGDTVWHRTGDAGYRDERGRLWLLGRCGARIADARGVLYPFAVECAAYEDPRVRRAAVVAHRDRRILVVDGYTAAERPDAGALERALARAQLDRVIWCKQIPVDKRHNAKVDYPALRKWLDRSVP